MMWRFYLIFFKRYQPRLNILFSLFILCLYIHQGFFFFFHLSTLWNLICSTCDITRVVIFSSLSQGLLILKNLCGSITCIQKCAQIINIQLCKFSKSKYCYVSKT